MRKNIWIAAVCVLFALSGSAIPDDREAWVVNGDGKSITIIDTDNEVVLQTIPLDQTASDPAPRGIAFSTLEGFDGAVVFVAQGSTLHRIEAASRTPLLPELDLGTELNLPTEIVDVFSAQNREFQTGLPLPAPATTIKAYLYVTANVDASGVGAEPYYIILDQQVLVGAGNPGDQPVVEFGPLVPPSIPPGDRGEAIGVSVLGAPSGNAFQRAWFTTRAGVGFGLLRSIELTKSDLVTAPWAVGRVLENQPNSGTAVPDFLRVAVPHDRELPVLPNGGKLINLDTAGECDLGGNLRQAAITGPGPGGYRLLAVDSAADQLVRVNPATCETDVFPVGTNPVAMATDTISLPGKTLVVNEGSNSVSILQPDGTVNDLPVGAAPNDIVTNRCCRGCTVRDLYLSFLSPNHDQLDWTRVGCNGCFVGVFCQCQDPFDTECPCYCESTTTTLPIVVGDCIGTLPEGNVLPSSTAVLSAPESETPWIFLGTSLTVPQFIHPNAAPHALNYAIAPIVP